MPPTSVNRSPRCVFRPAAAGLSLAAAGLILAGAACRAGNPILDGGGAQATAGGRRPGRSRTHP